MVVPVPILDKRRAAVRYCWTPGAAYWFGRIAFPHVLHILSFTLAWKLCRRWWWIQEAHGWAGGSLYRRTHNSCKEDRDMEGCQLQSLPEVTQYQSNGELVSQLYCILYLDIYKAFLIGCSIQRHSKHARPMEKRKVTKTSWSLYSW